MPRSGLATKLPGAALALAGLLFGCAAAAPGPTADERCLLRVWYRPTATRGDLQLTPSAVLRPELIGSWNDFQRPGLREFDRRQAPDGTQWWTVAMALPAGSYEYAIVVGEQLLTDDLNPQSTFRKNPLYGDSGPYEAEFSSFEVPDCTLPQLAVRESLSAPALAAAPGELAVTWRFAPGSLGAALDPGSISGSLRRGAESLTAPTLAVGAPAADGTQEVTARAGGLAAGKYTLSLQLRDALGKSPPPSLTSVFVEPATAPRALLPTRRLDDAVMYHLLIDRFRGPRGALNSPPTPGQRAGGTLAGVRAAVEAGYFARLGVTTLWLSPLYENPPGLHRGRDGNLYEAYHGYWPAAPRAVEPQLGDAAELDALVAAAHQRGLRLVFDAVPNHVYASHPYYAQHSRTSPAIENAPSPDQASWFTDGPQTCICGSPGCDWGSHILHCWFDSYLPDLNWRNPEVAQAGVADLLYWLSRFDLDGMRIDAVPMMPRAATRRIVRAAQRSVQRDGLDLLIVGEDYTGPGDGGRAEIRSFLGSHVDGLDSAFDFPLMWAVRAALATSRLGLDELEAELLSSARAFAGSGAVMAHILDNHDTPRFISEAAGNAGNDPWRAPPPQPSAAEPYQRQLMALTLLLTLPGLPVLYYGDEVGLAGANDPDARRPLPDVLGDALPPQQAELLAKTGRLGRLRACLPALRRGTRQVLLTAPEWSVALQLPPDAPRVAGEPLGERSPALVVLSRLAAGSGERKIFVSGIPAGRYRDVLSGEELTVPAEAADGSGGARVGLTARPLSAAVFIWADSPCLNQP